MKVFQINKFNSNLKIPVVLGSLIVAPLSFNNLNAQEDKFEYRVVEATSNDTLFERISVQSGNQIKETSDIIPSPTVVINGNTVFATFVVDLNTNKLYKYDKEGNFIDVYPVASGKKSTPTHTGIRRVTHVEYYPYRTASLESKRRQNPDAYGPRVICLETVDPKTGKTGITGEFIHGNGNPSSIGKYVSNGCIRMHNDVIKQLAAEVKRGDIVVIGRY